MRRALIVLLPVALLSLSLPWAAERASAKTAGPSEVTWKDMNYEQRREYMKKTVVPKMRPIFKEFDRKMFADFGCETCHGKDASNRKYKMPSPDIHPLPSTPEAFQAKLKVEPTWPKWTKFMGEKVEPAMGALLSMPVFDPKKPSKDAFSCAGCHKLE